MSVLPSGADIGRLARHVRLVLLRTSTRKSKYAGSFKVRLEAAWAHDGSGRLRRPHLQDNCRSRPRLFDQAKKAGGEVGHLTAFPSDGGGVFHRKVAGESEHWSPRTLRPKHAGSC